MPGRLNDLAQAIGRFDGAIDERIDRLRGHPHVDRLMYAASELGDFSLVWHLVNTGRPDL